MRQSVFFLSLVLCVVAATPAMAEDAPPFKVKDVAPGDDERPEGWNPVVKSGVIPDTAPTVKVLLALGKTAGIEDGTLSARSRSIQKEDDTAAVVSIVGIEVKNEAFTNGLADAAVKHGWKVRELASPMRVAVVWASKAELCEELLTWQAHLAAKKITQAAVRRSGSVSSMEQARALLGYVGNALKIEPESGMTNSFLANMLDRMRNPDGALAAYRKAVKADAPIPAPPYWQMQAGARIGHILLLKGNKEFLKEAAKALERAVELSEHAKVGVEKFGPVYNLACAYSRMGRLDDAFKALEKSLAIGKAELADEWGFHFEHAKVKDPDLEPLRGDPRFAEMLKKYDPNPAPEKDDAPEKPDGDGDGDK